MSRASCSKRVDAPLVKYANQHTEKELEKAKAGAEFRMAVFDQLPEHVQDSIRKKNYPFI